MPKKLSLPALLCTIHAHVTSWEARLADMMEGRAAELLKDVNPQGLSSAQKEKLRQVAEGRLSLWDLQADSKLWAVVAGCLDQARREIGCGPRELWGLVVAEISYKLQETIPGNEISDPDLLGPLDGALRDYCCHYRRKEPVCENALSREIARLDAAGFSEKLLAAIQKTHPEEAAEIGPRESLQTASDRPKKHWKKAEAEPFVRKYLKEDLYDSADRIAKRIGCSPSTVHKTLAWAEAMEKRKKKKSNPSNQQGGGGDSKVNREKPDVVLRLLMEKGTPEQRAALNTMSEEERNQTASNPEKLVKFIYQDEPL